MQPQGPARLWPEVVMSSVLVLSTLAVYGQLLRHPFINFDDDQYVYQNPMVRRGLTAEGIGWAFASFHAGNWHPLTWLSHMLDCQLLGLDPGLHHLTSLLLHIANTLLLYLILRRTTRRPYLSALVAALFALHPLHVESVAWVAERKDVLSAFFFMLTILAYFRYVEVPSHKRYLPVIATLAAGLMAKPMLVTLPFLLLLLDYWPLGRLRLDPKGPKNRLWSGFRPLVREKLPLFALVTISSIVTYLAQQKGEAVLSFRHLPLGSRIANSLVTYAGYIQSMIWPSRLTILYPYPAAGIPGWKVILALLLIAGITSLVLWRAPAKPFLATGWFWYLGMLVPVIGLIQVGSQAKADRYTYLPLIGLFLIIAWGLDQMADRWPVQRAVIFTLTASVLVVLGASARVQVGFWQNNSTLYEHALAVDPDNPSIMANLGADLAGQGRFYEAIAHYERALQLQPNSGRIHAALGTALAQRGERDKAMEHLRQALTLDPNLSGAHNSMGVLLLSQQKFSQATLFLREAARLDSANADAHNNLGAALLFQGQVPEAITEFNAALKLRPDFADAQKNLKTAMSVVRSPAR